jgi:NAD(P)-dependent dehydrogenase (short-subunit alcohol dehydrogenase family)
MRDASATAQFLAREREAIVTAATEALGRTAARHYVAAGAGVRQQRHEALLDHVIQALEDRNLRAVVAYAERIAQERFEAGYDLAEVQAAFNALEEAAWSRVFALLEPSQFADAIGLISTVVGAAKDALARRYVNLASNAHAPALDYGALFRGLQDP